MYEVMLMGVAESRGHELLGAALNLERGVVVPPARLEKRGEHRGIALFPRDLVALHELGDVQGGPIWLASALRRMR